MQQKIKRTNSGEIFGLFLSYEVLQQVIEYLSTWKYKGEKPIGELKERLKLTSITTRPGCADNIAHLNAADVVVRQSSGAKLFAISWKPRPGFKLPNLAKVTLKLGGIIITDEITFKCPFRITAEKGLWVSSQLFEYAFTHGLQFGLTTNSDKEDYLKRGVCLGQVEIIWVEETREVKIKPHIGTCMLWEETQLEVIKFLETLLNSFIPKNEDTSV